MDIRQDYEEPSIFIATAVLVLWCVGFGVVYMLYNGIS